jgi:hypothetical protein
MSQQLNIDLNDYTAEDQEKIQSTLGKLEQAQQIQHQIFELADLCFTKCIQKVRQPDDKGDLVCVNNCSERFFDATAVIMKSFPAFQQMNSSE